MESILSNIIEVNKTKNGKIIIQSRDDAIGALVVVILKTLFPKKVVSVFNYSFPFLSGAIYAYKTKQKSLLRFLYWLFLYGILLDRILLKRLDLILLISIEMKQELVKKILY